MTHIYRLCVFTDNNMAYYNCTIYINNAQFLLLQVITDPHSLDTAATGLLE